VELKWYFFVSRWFTVILRAWILARTARASASNSSTLSTPASSRTNSRGRSTTDCSSIRSSGGQRARRIPSTLPTTSTVSSISGTQCRRRMGRDRSWTAARRGRPTSEQSSTSSDEGITDNSWSNLAFFSFSNFKYLNHSLKNNCLEKISRNAFLLSCLIFELWTWEEKLSLCEKLENKW